jgi:hypothetical protein
VTSAKFYDVWCKRLAAEGKVVGFHGTSQQNASSILRQGFEPSRNGTLGPGVYWSTSLEK